MFHIAGVASKMAFGVHMWVNKSINILSENRSAFSI